MKTLKIPVLVLFASVSLNAQNVVEIQVPKHFAQDLLEVYLNATKIEWERNNDNI